MMAPTSLPPDDGENGYALEVPTGGLKLGDAERIAAERLDGAPPGSLKEALAIDPTGPVAEPTGAPSVAESPAASESLAALVVGARADTGEPGSPPASDSALPTTAEAPPQPGAAVVQSVQPLANALDAAVKLAADANAAAEALESLRRLLETRTVTSAPNPDPATPPSPRAAARSPAPPSLSLAGETGGLSGLAPALPAAPPPRVAAAERRHLDVRGFFAGVALSCAIGVVLYLFMTAG
jgi:hypothetical protein